MPSTHRRDAPGSGAGLPAGVGGAVRPLGMLVTVAVVLLSGLVAPGPVGAQEGTDAFDLVQLQRRYEAAVSACEAAVLARRADQPEYDRRLQEVSQADRSGDETALAQAQTRFLEISQVIDERQRRVVEQCNRADQVRRDYLEALDARRRALEDELAASTDARRRADLRGLLADIDNRYSELEADRGGLEVQLVMRPLIDIAATDTPDAVELKAAFLERMITMADSVLADLDTEMERLESRLRRQQQRENFQANLGRFEDTRTPVGSSGDERDRPAAGDSTALSPQSLEERIRAIRDARLRVEFYREQMLARVREFEEYLARIT